MDEGKPTWVSREDAKKKKDLADCCLGLRAFA